VELVTEGHREVSIAQRRQSERNVTQRETLTRSRHALTPAQAFDAAVTLHRQGRLGEAGQIYRAILKLDSNHFGALQYLGMICTSEGNPQEAERLIRQALMLKPDSAEVRNNLGIALAALNRLDEALAEYEKAVEIDPCHVEARNNLGNTLHTLDRSSEAIAHFEQALAVRSETAEVYNNLGNALAAVQRKEEAIASFRRALAIRADFTEAHNNLGFVLASLSRHDEAIGEYEKAIALRPHYFEAHNNLANTLIALKRHAEAIAHFRSALAVRPDAAETHNNFGNVLSVLKQHTEAASHYRKAIKLKPEFFEAHNNLGNALAALERHEEALSCYGLALAANPDFADAHCNLGNSLAELGRHDDAIACYRRALAISPDMAEAHGSLGNELRTLGRLEEARHALAKAVELAPCRADLHRSLTESKRYAAGDPQLAAMEELATNMKSLSEDERMELHFALAKAYADCGEHTRSFGHLLDGNALKRGQVRYDEVASLAKFGRLKSVFTPELIREKRDLGHPSELPIFIIGMPRSGTTLVEQVLASHRRICGGGELRHMGKAVAILERADSGGTPFPELVPSMGGHEFRQVAEIYLTALRPAAAGVERITDKMTGNFLLAGLIHLAMPKARIIHVQRNSVDTCLSCFSKLFGSDIPFCYELAELGRYYRAYEDLMAHWRRVLPDAMLDVQYEDLVADFEPQVRRMLAFCGLDWDERCLAFHSTQRPVRTASAAWGTCPVAHPSNSSRSRT
jgi:tetratricopeptide (TPR) repeat protein